MNIEDATGPGVGTWRIERLRSWNINTLTDVQIRALNAGIANGCSMIVSAPTSTGKTLVGKIAVLTALQKGVRAIYLVLQKALADQQFMHFFEMFGENAAEPIATVGLNNKFSCPFFSSEVRERGELAIRRDVLVKEHQLSDRQAKALGHILQYGHLTIKDFEGLCPEVNRRSLQRDLKVMLDMGLLISEGATNKLIYRMKENG